MIDHDIHQLHNPNNSVQPIHDFSIDLLVQDEEYYRAQPQYEKGENQEWEGWKESRDREEVERMIYPWNEME